MANEKENEVTPPEETPFSPLTPDEPSPLEDEAEGDKESVSGQVDDFLQELNLSRRHIFYGIGCFVLILGMIFGAIRGYRWYVDTRGQRQEEVASSITDAAVTAGTVVTLTPEVLAETGILEAVSMGAPRISETPISRYILHFRRLQNAFETDLKASLDASTDRRARLESHIALLKDLLGTGSHNLAAIADEMNLIEAVYASKSQLQDSADANFFVELKALNPETSENLLDQFISNAQDALALRARFKTLQRIAGFYNEALPKVERRIRDMELNKDALVSGLKVYDVSGSDLQLIVPVDNGDAAAPAGSASGADAATGPSAERLSSPSSALPFLPVHPSKVKTGGKDFITEPGGGFR